MAELLKGFKIVKLLQKELICRVEKLKVINVVPTLSIVRVGNREDDLSYESSAIKRCNDVGIIVKTIVLDENINTDELTAIISEINNDSSIHGILLFRPLPKHIDEMKVVDMISPAKDVDCCTSVNLFKIFAGDDSGFAPSTPEAVITMLKYYDIPLEGSKITIIGRSMVVGKPLAMLLIKENATIKICHTRTKDVRKEAKDSDILIVAAGRAEMIDDSYVDKNTIVIDVGINVSYEGKLVGDVAFSKVEPIVKAISPVPKGIGGVTTVMLIEHVIRAAENTTKLKMKYKMQ